MLLAESRWEFTCPCFRYANFAFSLSRCLQLNRIAHYDHVWRTRRPKP